jgi:hypothetical protein
MVIVIQSWSVILSSSFLLNYLSLVIAVSTVLHTVYQDTTTTQAFCNSNYDALPHAQEKSKYSNRRLIIWNSKSSQYVIFFVSLNLYKKIIFLWMFAILIVINWYESFNQYKDEGLVVLTTYTTKERWNGLNIKRGKCRG